MCSLENDLGGDRDDVQQSKVYPFRASEKKRYETVESKKGGSSGTLGQYVSSFCAAPKNSAKSSDLFLTTVVSSSTNYRIIGFLETRVI